MKNTATKPNHEGHGKSRHPNKGKPQTAEAALKNLAGAMRGGEVTAGIPDADQTGINLAQHWRNVERIKAAEARLREAKARTADLVELELAGALIRSELVGEWTRALTTQMRADIDAAIPLVDLHGHPEPVAESVRKILNDILGRLRHRLATAKQLGTPPPTIAEEDRRDV